MDKKTKLKILKIIIFFIAVAICVGITCYLFPFMRNLATREGQLAFKERVNQMGMVYYYYLQYKLHKYFYLYFQENLLKYLQGCAMEDYGELFLY